MVIPVHDHGGDGAAVAAAVGFDPTDVLDLSASLNPFAPDLVPILVRHMERGALVTYPDPSPGASALARAIGVDPDRILLTNGGAQSIALVAQHLESGWVEEPEFSLYRRHLRHLDPNAPRWRSNPNNPSGLLASPEAVAGVWDEAFYPLATGSWTRGDCGSYVVGSLTKLLGCPGLRVGYVIAPDEDSARQLARLQPEWSVNGLASAALPELLEMVDLPGWCKDIDLARAELVAMLQRNGYQPRPSQANWVLVDVPDAQAERARLARRGVVVRDCTSFGMPTTVRIAVPDARGLEVLERALAGCSKKSSRRQAGGYSPRGRALLICGTASDAGKSTIVAGLCRLMARRGVRVAPFKAQNMALNSWVTSKGAEIGRAQAAQAMAAGVEALPEMNPILLKPTAERASQVVVLGRPWKVMDGASYQRAKHELMPVVLESLEALRRDFDLVICEGAGSPAEVNLLEGDLVNLGLAQAAQVPAVVVGDIDRGGALAAMYGTWAFLPEHLRRHIRGYLVNKFRGDPELLASGLQAVEARTGLPVLGVVPWIKGLGIDDEDSLALGAWDRHRADGAVDVAVVIFPRISNFTDMDPLRQEPGVRVRLVDNEDSLGDPDLLILPGTKETVADLDWLRSTGIAARIGQMRGVVLGICGGYQMLGHRIVDQVESGRGEVAGLGLLPVETSFEPEKVTRQRSGCTVKGALSAGIEVRGYQIHHGRVQGATPWFDLCGEPEGAFDEARGIYGTTLHGLFENDRFRHELLEMVARRKGVPFVAGEGSFAESRITRVDAIASAIEAHVDVDKLLELAR